VQIKDRYFFPGRSHPDSIFTRHRHLLKFRDPLDLLGRSLGMYCPTNIRYERREFVSQPCRHQTEQRVGYFRISARISPLAAACGRTVKHEL